jgi:hypothetical protein
MMTGVKRNVVLIVRGLVLPMLMLAVGTDVTAASGRPAHLVEQRHATPSLPCGITGQLGGTSTACYLPGQFGRYGSGLPFAAVNPAKIVRTAAHLSPDIVVVHRVAYPPTGVSVYPVGAPISIEMDFGNPPATIHWEAAPRRTATWVRVSEYWLSQTGRPRVSSPRPGGQWMFTADVPHQAMTISVQSDGSRAMVSAIGYAVYRAEKRLPLKPPGAEQVYVTAPHVLHTRRPATFWVLAGLRWGTRATGGYDVDFALGGGWNRPRTVTPDGSQACGGDNIAGQPFRRRGRWVFRWGDCEELGLILTPRGTGLHTLTIYTYRVPVTSRGQLDFSREIPAPGPYRWHGIVRG